MKLNTCTKAKLPDWQLLPLHQNKVGRLLVWGQIRGYNQWASDVHYALVKTSRVCPDFLHTNRRKNL